MLFIWSATLPRAFSVCWPSRSAVVNVWLFFFVGFCFIVLMEAAPVKSQPLHNFNLPFLKWGTHRGGGSSNASADHHRYPESDSDHDCLRPTRVGSRSTRIHRFSFPPPPKPIQQSHREEEEKQHEQEESLKPQKNEADGEGAEDETVQRPWNLRPRKVVVETSMAVVTTVVEKMSERAAPKSMRLRGLTENGGVVEKKEKKKFWIALSKEEIEEDIFVMTGSRPARRPKKRPKNIQKQLDNVFPGLWLAGTTADAYRVADAPIKEMVMVFWNSETWELCRVISHSDLKIVEASLHRWGAEFEARVVKFAIP